MTVAIIDGLLFAESVADVRSLSDLRLFLRTNYRTVKIRRDARQGYIGIEGLRENPPEYVDKVVWPELCQGPFVPV
jgi:nicotinamide/nicotinate riboside kinase